MQQIKGENLPEKVLSSMMFHPIIRSFSGCCERVAAPRKMRQPCRYNSNRLKNCVFYDIMYRHEETPFLEWVKLQSKKIKTKRWTGMENYNNIINLTNEMQNFLIASFERGNPEKFGDNWTNFTGWLHHGAGQPYQTIVMKINKELAQFFGDQWLFEEFVCFVKSPENYNTNFLDDCPALANTLEKELLTLLPAAEAWNKTLAMNKLKIEESNDPFFDFAPKSDKKYQGTGRWVDLQYLKQCKSEPATILQQNFIQFTKEHSDYDSPKEKRQIPRPEGIHGTVILLKRDPNAGQAMVYHTTAETYSQWAYDNGFKENVEMITPEKLSDFIEKSEGLLQDFVGEKRKQLANKIYFTAKTAQQEYDLHCKQTRTRFSIISPHGMGGRKNAADFISNLPQNDLSASIQCIGTLLNEDCSKKGAGNFNHWSFKTRLMLALNSDLDLRLYGLKQDAPRDKAEEHKATLITQLRRINLALQPKEAQDVNEEIIPEVPNL